MQTRCVDLWARVLRQVPNSRLLLKAKAFADPEPKARVEQLFQKRGIDPCRLDLLALIPCTKSHLEAYSNVDIGLDPFPYAGTTTTCEALYMGVPVVTLGTQLGKEFHAQNVGVSLLTCIGHTEWIARTETEYVGIADRLARDLSQLRRIRTNLRGRMMSSPLGQHRDYLRAVEEMFYDMWKTKGGCVDEDQLNPSTQTTPQSAGAWKGELRRLLDS